MYLFHSAHSFFYLLACVMCISSVGVHTFKSIRYGAVPVFFIRFRYVYGADTGYFLYWSMFRFDSVACVSAWKSVVGAGLAPCKIHSVALSTLFQVLRRALVSIVVQFQWRPALDDAIANSRCIFPPIPRLCTLCCLACYISSEAA